MVLRGRGRSAGLNGTELNRDRFDRRIVFMVENLVRTEEEGTLNPVQWAR